MSGLPSREASDRTDVDLLNGVLSSGLFGVPGYLITTLLPSLRHLAARRPKLVKLLCVLVTVFAFGSTTFRRLKSSILSFLVSNFMFSVTMYATDPLSAYFARWLENRRMIFPGRLLQARSSNAPAPMHSAHGTIFVQQPACNAVDTIHFESLGLRVFWHKWRPIFVAQRHDKSLHTDVLTVRSFGLSPQPLKEILREAYQTYRSQDKDQVTRVFHPKRHVNGWKIVASRTKRRLDTIVLDSKEKENIVDDVKFYISAEAKKWYATRGIPYRRGYLFHGRPGTGKTSLSMAIAGEFNIDIYILSLLEQGMDDARLHALFAKVPSAAIILLEDIDSAGLTREVAGEPTNSLQSSNRDRNNVRVTLSGLLNAIDGVDSPEGHILMLTTNALDALDQALIRPGRIDYRIEFRACCAAQAEALFTRMYLSDGLNEADIKILAAKFGRHVPAETMTPAELQGFLLKNRRDPKDALDKFIKWTSDMTRGHNGDKCSVISRQVLIPGLGTTKGTCEAVSKLVSLEEEDAAQARYFAELEEEYSEEYSEESSDGSVNRDSPSICWSVLVTVQ